MTTETPNDRPSYEVAVTLMILAMIALIAVAAYFVINPGKDVLKIDAADTTGITAWMSGARRDVGVPSWPQGEIKNASDFDLNGLRGRIVVLPSEEEKTRPPSERPGKIIGHASITEAKGYTAEPLRNWSGTVGERRPCRLFLEARNGRPPLFAEFSVTASLDGDKVVPDLPAIHLHREPPLLKGQVLDTDGAPFPGVRVSVGKPIRHPGNTVIHSEVAYGWALKEGRFTVYRSPNVDPGPGPFTVRVDVNDVLRGDDNVGIIRRTFESGSEQTLIARRPALVYFPVNKVLDFPTMRLGFDVAKDPSIYRTYAFHPIAIQKFRSNNEYFVVPSGRRKVRLVSENSGRVEWNFGPQELSAKGTNYLHRLAPPQHVQPFQVRVIGRSKRPLESFSLTLLEMPEGQPRRVHGQASSGPFLATGPTHEVLVAARGHFPKRVRLKANQSNTVQLDPGPSLRFVLDEVPFEEGKWDSLDAAIMPRGLKGRDFARYLGAQGTDITPGEEVVLRADCNGPFDLALSAQTYHRPWLTVTYAVIPLGLDLKVTPESKVTPQHQQPTNQAILAWLALHQARITYDRILTVIR